MKIRRIFVVGREFKRAKDALIQNFVLKVTSAAHSDLSLE